MDSMRFGAVQFTLPNIQVSIVKIPDEDIKGRIIGKEGRNIRALKQATGVRCRFRRKKSHRLSSFDQVEEKMLDAP